MKIGIITHHYVKNYGAFLQAKGLIEILSRIYPAAQIEIIDYVYFSHWGKNILHVLHFRKGIDTLQSYAMKIKQLAMFSKYEHTLPRSKKVRSADDIKKLNYDLIVFGSDEIWDRKGRGFRKLKYGVGMNDFVGNMIAYAPSVGKVDGDEPLPQELAEGMKNFSRISARDTETQKMVRNIGINAPIVLDPTLLYSFEKDLQEEKVVARDYRYILIYDCKLTEQQVEIIRVYSKEHNLEIVGGGDSKAYYTKNNLCMTPYEWVSLFKNADFVITGTFHGTIFSVKYRKDFIAFPTEKNRVRKISSLLNNLCLTERLAQTDDVDVMQKLLHQKTDYQKCDEIICHMEKESLNFLSLKESASDVR